MSSPTVLLKMIDNGIKLPKIAELAAASSASGVDRATDDCFLAHQESGKDRRQSGGPDSRMINIPEVLLHDVSP